MSNRVERLVDRLVKEERLGDLERELLQLRSAGLTREEERAWHHFYGIEAFRKGNRPEAFKRFREAAEKFPDAPEIIFSLGQEHEHRGETAAMIACFAKARFPAVPASYALTQARYAYLWGTPDEGLSYIEPIFQVYFELKIVDDTFLHIRGLPFFSEPWRTFVAFHWLKGDLTPAVERLDECMKQLGDYEFGELADELDGMRKGNFRSLLVRNREMVRWCGTKGLPCGTAAMQNAVLESRELGYEEGIAALDRVTLEPRDFPWLEDVRTAAKAALARRHGKIEEERRFRETFMARQPLLFEPHHAVHYQILEYQEDLKKGYRAARRPPGGT